MPILLLMALSACNSPSPAWRVDAPRVSADVSALDFGAVALGTSASAELLLSNRGGAAAEVQLTLDDPRFATTRELLAIPPLTDVQLTLWFTPQDAEPASASLELLAPELLTVTLFGATNPDGDADGHDHVWLGGDDCDDGNPDVHPGAPDTWYDGLDADCAANSDFDADQDGHDAAPDGDDCLDTNAEAYPGAVDAWYDGVDADCAADSDFDADQDGYDAVPNGDDCLDSDGRVYPGRAETWYDGLDGDCSGGSDYDADLDGADIAPHGEDCDDADPNLGPNESELSDGLDQDCDGLIDEHELAFGDVLLTELLAWPTADPDDEFIELFNARSTPVYLDNWTIVTAQGIFTLPEATLLGPGQWLVLCRTSANQMSAWCDLSWNEAFSLDSLGDSVSIAAGAFTLDSVRWDASWGIPQSQSWSLSTYDATANDSANAWCASSAPLGVDSGTPGAANDACPPSE